MSTADEPKSKWKAYASAHKSRRMRAVVLPRDAYKLLMKLAAENHSTPSKILRDSVALYKIAVDSHRQKMAGQIVVDSK